MKAKKAKVITALSLTTLALAGCYVVPVTGPDGQPTTAIYPVPPAPAHTPYPITLHARLYPANELANRSGMLVGTVTNLRTGKGRFQHQYANEVLTGEATRHGNDDKTGIASAYGTSGSFMQCEYRMNTPAQGAGTCTFSNGAQYRLHIGS